MTNILESLTKYIQPGIHSSKHHGYSHLALGFSKSTINPNIIYSAVEDNLKSITVELDLVINIKTNKCCIGSTMRNVTDISAEAPLLF